MKNIVAVGIGGAIGVLLRYQIGSWLNFSLFPLGTLFTNVLGTFVLGALTGLFARKGFPQFVQLGLGTGICGGFTTMSTFTAEIINLWESSSLLSILYIGSSLTLGLIAGYIGLMLGVMKESEGS